MPRPNILLITSDQQHWNTLGIDNPDVQTPNLDALAARGTRFTRGYCVNPTCTPTRASIITGKYPSQHGAYSLGTKLPEDEPTVGEVFSRHRYRTTLVGKAHFQQLLSTPKYASLESHPLMQDLDFWRDFHGPFYGFDHVELARNHADENHVGQHYALWMEEKGLTNWRDYFQPPTGTNSTQRHTWEIPEEYHYDAWISERTNALMEEYAGKGENFFLWASFFDPHPPYLVPRPWDRMVDPATLSVPTIQEGEHAANPPHFQLTQTADPDFSAWEEANGHAMHGFHSHRHDRDAMARNLAIYYGMVSLMDHHIGRILAKLDSLGLRENTLVVFSTDHGHFFGQHGLTAKGPFHYEDMIRVPWIVSWPGQVPEGRRSDALQSLVDLPPTFLNACGLDVPADMTGVDQMPVWLGRRDTARDNVIVENRHQPTTIHAKTYVDARYKLTVYWQRDYGELFDLHADPAETHNLWNDPDSQPLKAELTLKLLRAEMKKEEPLTPETATKPQKAEAMYVRRLTEDGYTIDVAPEPGADGLYQLAADPVCADNRWDDPAARPVRDRLVARLLHLRMANEPLWMPRVAVA